MSSQAELSRRFNRLKEISSIMTAMKNLSLVETRKLARFMGHQRQMLANIEAATADFLHFYPQTSTVGGERNILLLIGSERGFCGGFNEHVLARLDTLPAWSSPPHLVVVGHRLAARLGERTGVITRIDGATVTEDVPFVLGRLMDALHAASLHSFAAGVVLYGLAHSADGEPELKRLLPLPPSAAPRYTHKPQIQLPAAELFAELLDQYLLAVLHGLLYESLTAENRQRLAHMENALDRLDETVTALALKRNALRQEKIIEEIEVMLSSRQAFDEG